MVQSGPTVSSIGESTSVASASRASTPEGGPAVSILVDPLLQGEYVFTEGVRILGRCLRGWANPHHRKWEESAYRGHFAVTRSLVEGLQELGLPFNYAPRFVWQLHRIAIVLSGVRTLRQAIGLKRKGCIDRLFAGPTIVALATDANGLIASPEIDGVITAGEWVVDMFTEDFPQIGGRTFAWPAGVDTRYWSPTASARRDHVVVYEKHAKGPVGPIDPYVSLLRQRGYSVTILKYGEYRHDQYLAELRNAAFVVGFVKDENQGIAWSEAWSTNVPTFLWRNEINTQRGRTFRCSTSPYLTPSTGLFFDDVEDFLAKLELFEQGHIRFSPRSWVLEHMTDAACALDLYRRVTEPSP